MGRLKNCTYYIPYWIVLLDDLIKYSQQLSPLSEIFAVLLSFRARMQPLLSDFRVQVFNQSVIMLSSKIYWINRVSVIYFNKGNPVPRVELQDHMIALFLAFKGTSILFVFHLLWLENSDQKGRPVFRGWGRTGNHNAYGDDWDLWKCVYGSGGSCCFRALQHICLIVNDPRAMHLRAISRSASAWEISLGCVI